MNFKTLIFCLFCFSFLIETSCGQNTASISTTQSPDKQTTNSAQVAVSGSPFMINTAQKNKLNKRIHGACIVNINYTAMRKGTPTIVDVLSNPYFALFDSLQWTTVEWTGDASAHYNRLKVNDSNIKGGDGNNCSDCEAVNSVCCIRFGKDFFNENVQLMRKAGIKNFDYTANITAGTIEEALWACKNGAGWIQGELELSTKKQIPNWPDGVKYRKVWQTYIDSIHKYYPKVIFESDAAPIWSKQERDIEWNNALVDIRGDSSKRMYLWDDDCFTTTADWNYNLAQINKAYDQTYPERIKMMLKKFPGDSVNIAQWGMKNFQEPSLDHTMAGAHLIVKAYTMFQSTPMINHAFFMSMKQLIDKDLIPMNNYKILVLAGKFVAGCDSVFSMTMPDGLAGMVGVKGKNYFIFVSNQTGTAKTYSGIAIDKVAQNVVCNQISYKATSLSASDFTYVKRNEKDILLDNNSVSLIYFTKP